MLDVSSDSPEWLIHEDWALLQCIQSLQDLPLQLLTNSPAHIPNWDLVSDVVNASSRTYRYEQEAVQIFFTVGAVRCHRDVTGISGEASPPPPPLETRNIHRPVCHVKPWPKATCQWTHLNSF